MPLPSAQIAPPLPPQLVDAADRLTRDLDQAGLWWLSGYAAGLASRAATAPSAPAVVARHDAATSGRLTIVYGSQTGNARRIAEQLATEAEQAGLAVRLQRADAYPSRELKVERHLVLVVSTQGDGDPSDDARELYDFITGKRAPRLDQLHYAVLGLGDSSYPQFCVIGQKLDARLAELGAQRMLARGDADLDIDSVAAPWRAQALAVAKEVLKPSATVTPLRTPAVAIASTLPSRDQPFAAELLVNQRITTARSSKDIRHVELSLEDSGLHYTPGDALGVWPRNPGPLVDSVLDTLRLDGDTTVAHGEQSLPLREWLAGKRELTRLARPFVAAHAERGNHRELKALLAGDNATLANWLDGRQVIDLLHRHPAQWPADALVATLRPLLPRLYSIASSQKAVGDEVHLTVAHVEYQRENATRHGVASHFLASRPEGATLPVYIEPNERFRLPADGTRDVIMIGPGTGVAPFRGFVQERVADGASGRNWLFFGNPHFRSDFLYQLEWQRALKSGQLHRLDLAFSRDPVSVAGTHTDVWALSAQQHRTYVQQRLRERGRELYDWLQDGAHLYVCGAIAMGKDVHAALLGVVAAHNGNDADAAVEFLDGLQQQGRYARDVY